MFIEKRNGQRELSIDINDACLLVFNLKNALHENTSYTRKPRVNGISLSDPRYQRN